MGVVNFQNNWSGKVSGALASVASAAKTINDAEISDINSKVLTQVAPMSDGSMSKTELSDNLNGLDNAFEEQIKGSNYRVQQATRNHFMKATKGVRQLDHKNKQFTYKSAVETKAAEAASMAETKFKVDAKGNWTVESVDVNLDDIKVESTRRVKNADGSFDLVKEQRKAVDVGEELNIDKLDTRKLMHSQVLQAVSLDRINEMTVSESSEDLRHAYSSGLKVSYSGKDAVYMKGGSLDSMTTKAMLDDTKYASAKLNEITNMEYTLARTENDFDAMNDIYKGLKEDVKLGLNVNKSLVNAISTSQKRMGILEYTDATTESRRKQVLKELNLSKADIRKLKDEVAINTYHEMEAQQEPAARKALLLEATRLDRLNNRQTHKVHWSSAYANEIRRSAFTTGVTEREALKFNDKVRDAYLAEGNASISPNTTNYINMGILTLSSFNN